MEKRDSKGADRNPSPEVAPAAARVTRPPNGLAVDEETWAGVPSAELQLAAQEQLERVPGKRLPKKLRPSAAPGLALPVACAGGACLLRDQFRQIAQRCKHDKACIQAEIAKIKIPPVQDA